jgi:hypothetical protein
MQRQTWTTFEGATLILVGYLLGRGHYEPEHLRRANVVTPPLITHLQVGADTFVGLALQQQGSIVMSLETSGAYVAVALYANLVAHIEEWGEPTSFSRLTVEDLGGFYAVHSACPGVALVPKLLEGAR